MNTIFYICRSELHVFEIELLKKILETKMKWEFYDITYNENFICTGHQRLSE
jgi:hypothetical protein